MSEIDPEVAAIIAERKKSEEAFNEAAPEAVAEDDGLTPEIRAIIEERKKEGEDVNLTDAQRKEANDALIPEPPTTLETVGENLLNKAKRVLSPEDALAIGSGAATGLTLPSRVNKFTPVMNKANEARLEAMNDPLNPAGKESKLHQNIVSDYEREHHVKALNLQDDIHNAAQRAADAEENVRKAQIEHDNAKIHNERYLPNSQPPAAPVAAKSELTRIPVGGAAAQNYDIAHGGTEPESLKAPSTSKVQQDIPGRTEAWNKIAEIGPEYERTKESPLLLNQNEQKYKLEQLNKQIGQENDQSKQEKQRADREEKAQKNAAKVQAEAQRRLEEAQKQHEEAMKALRKIERDYESHNTTPKVSIETKAKARDELERNLGFKKFREEYEGKGLTSKGLSAAARLLLGRFSPVVAGAAVPEQAAAAKRYYDKGDIQRALAYGSGALGSAAMTAGKPQWSAVGALANLPALYYEVNDLQTPDQPPAKP